MGKKATILLFNSATIFITFIISILGILGWIWSFSSPLESDISSLLGIIMMPIIILNVISAIYWVVKLKWWVIPPLIAIAVNINALGATLQLRFKDKEDNSKNSIKIATYNTHGAAQPDINFTMKSIASFFEDEEVDIACLQEYKEHKKYPLDSIAKHFKSMPYMAAQHTTKGDINLIIFSRYPIKRDSFTQFGEAGNGSLWVDIDVNGKMVRVFNNHLQTTNINQSRREIEYIKQNGITNNDGKETLDIILMRLKTNAKIRAKQVISIRNIIDTTNSSIIVCGDFNETPYSNTYRVMSNNLKDGFKECGKGFAYTYKPFKLFRLDYILYSKDIIGIKYSSPSLEWSDHKPVLLKVSLR